MIVDPDVTSHPELGNERSCRRSRLSFRRPRTTSATPCEQQKARDITLAVVTSPAADGQRKIEATSKWCCLVSCNLFRHTSVHSLARANFKCTWKIYSSMYIRKSDMVMSILFIHLVISVYSSLIHVHFTRRKQVRVIFIRIFNSPKR